jgi:hypothetical protein
MGALQYMFRQNDKMPLVGRLLFVLVGVAFAFLAFSVVEAGKFDVFAEWEARALAFSIVESEHALQFWVQVAFMVMFSLTSIYLVLRKGENHA